MKKSILFISALILGSSAFAAEPGESPKTVHSITLPAYSPALPDAPGREVFATNCEACHSSRYITMQPKMTAAKWEAEVRKMAATYAAPIAESDVPTLVNYLMMTRESGNAPAVWEMPAAPTPSVDVSQVIHTATNPEERQKDLEAGRALFTKNCMSCHGQSGVGDGIAAAPLMPKPGNLTAHRYTDEALTEILKKGVRATAMPSWAVLSNDDLRRVMTFVQSLSEVEDQPAYTPGPWAKTLFMQNCINCHGADGAANGASAAVLPAPPANFQLKQASETYASDVIANGHPGTAMPAWHGKLSEAQRLLLVDYVRSLYKGKAETPSEEHAKE